MGRNELTHKTLVTAVVVAPFIGFLVAIALLWQRYVFVSDLVLMGVFYTLAALGVTIGYHRMLTHRSFQAPDWVRAIFTILGAMSFDGRPIPWVATHIDHHAHSDKEGDPHSPLDGFWHAHMGWLFSSANFSDPKRYAPHLLKDPLIVTIDRLSPFWLVLSLVLPLMLGGWTGFLWGGLVRIFLTNHVTWSVNSVCHTFGRRAFEVEDASHNHWVVGLLAFGEGWHNNHHAFPSSAFHGLRWWQFDLSALIIRGLEKMGLAWDVKRVNAEVVNRKQDEAKVMTAVQKAREELISLRERLPNLRPLCNEAINKISEIQTRVAEHRQIKRQKIKEYLEEVRSVISQVRQSAI